MGGTQRRHSDDMKRFSTSLIMDIQIKTTVRNSLTPVTMATIKSWKWCREKGILLHW